MLRWRRAAAGETSNLIRRSWHVCERIFASVVFPLSRKPPQLRGIGDGLVTKDHKLRCPVMLNVDVAVDVGATQGRGGGDGARLLVVVVI
jgi:hypothetical protein